MSDKEPKKEKWQEIAEVARNKLQLRNRVKQGKHLFKKLNPKQIDFCYAMTNAHEYKTLKQLADQFDVDPRTIRSWKLNPAVIDYILVLKNEQQQRFCNMMNRRASKFLDILERNASLDCTYFADKGTPAEQKRVDTEAVEVCNASSDRFINIVKELGVLSGTRQPEQKSDESKISITQTNVPQTVNNNVNDLTAPLTPVEEGSADRVNEILANVKALHKDEEPDPR